MKSLPSGALTTMLLALTAGACAYTPISPIADAMMRNKHAMAAAKYLLSRTSRSSMQFNGGRDRFQNLDAPDAVIERMQQIERLNELERSLQADLETAFDNGGFEPENLFAQQQQFGQQQQQQQGEPWQQQQQQTFQGSSFRDSLQQQQQQQGFQQQPNWDEARMMGPSDVVEFVCSGLQNNDRGDNNDGMRRLYQFVTPQGRCYMAPPPPYQGRVEGVDEEFFVETACDPVFALMGCDSYAIVESTSVPPTMTRGGLATVKVSLTSYLHGFLNSQRCTRSDGSVRPQPVKRVPLGSGDRVLQKIEGPGELLDYNYEENNPGAAAYLRQAYPAGVSTEALVSPYRRDQSSGAQTRTLLFGLEQQRRPPLEGVWLIKEVLPLEQTLFQVMNKGSTEDW